MFLSFIFSVGISGSIRVVNRVNNSMDDIATLDRLRGTYVSTKDISRILAKRDPFINKERGKMVLYIDNHRIKISGNSSFILIDEQVYQMPMYAIVTHNDIFLPAESFFDILKRTVLPGINYDPKREFLDVDVVQFTITAIDVEEKSNGTIVRLKTRKAFSERNISSFINKHG